MSAGTIIVNEGTVVLPPRLFATVDYYAILASYRYAVIDTAMRFDKRVKSVHRYSIADTQGVLSLTVPIVRPQGATTQEGVTWDRVEVSAHGRWWDVHSTALASAYGRTPFYEFYADRFSPLFAPRPIENETVGDLVLQSDAIIRSILGLETELLDEVPESATDYRRILPDMPVVPYWQIRADKFGFIGKLSILDLIFNLGPEAPLLLRQMAILSHL